VAVVDDDNIGGERLDGRPSLVALGAVQICGDGQGQICQPDVLCHGCFRPGFGDLDGGDLCGGDGAAVDDVVGTDDRGGGIGDEEADELGDFVRPGGAAQRDAPEGVHE
jgi:hypothetical protein